MDLNVIFLLMNSRLLDLSFVLTSGSQSENCGPEASASPENLLEMQIYRPHFLIRNSGGESSNLLLQGLWVLLMLTEVWEPLVQTNIVNGLIYFSVNMSHKNIKINTFNTNVFIAQFLFNSAPLTVSSTLLT